MAKLSDVTKEITQQAGGMLEETGRIRRNIDSLLQQLKKQESQLARAEEEAERRRKEEENQNLISQHTKAWTMPDDEDKPVEKASEKSAEKPAEKSAAPEKVSASVKEMVEVKDVKKAETEKETVKAASASEEKETAHKEPAAKKAEAAEKQDKKPSAKAEVKTGEKKAASAETGSSPIPQMQTPKETVNAAATANRPENILQNDAASAVRANVSAQPAQNARPANAQPAAQGQKSMNPGAQNARPVNQQGAYGRPANQQGNLGRPANGQPAQLGRPANGQPGQFGRPANGQPGQYSRPVNSQPGQFVRPANGQPGQFGRPANGQPSQYGRPANGQPGQFGRPANGQPGQFGRPVNGQPGQFGRPANGQPGQFGRPANGQAGQFGRPANAQSGNRPQQGGQGRSQNQQRRAPVADMPPLVEKERVSNYDPNKKNYVRQHDPEHVAKNRKQLQKENLNNSGYDDEVVRGGKRARNVKKQVSAQQMMAPIKIEKAYMTADTITVKDLTERIGKPAGEILKKLLMLGIMSNINSELDFDTASLVCSEFDVELEMKLDKTAEDELTAEVEVQDTEEVLQERPPVITIMGHVDHGKTSLLDYIRKAKVTATEAGGITQHIGAYTINLDGRQITFLDTPGHEAFTAMRLRGAQATDIAVLVVAADDGVMPQTVEAINHARAAKVPIIVAINKIDKPAANPDRVKQDLTKYDLVPEEWGGDTIMAPVSALTGEGVNELLEMILLQADVMQLRANPDRMARGVIIEAKLDKSRGPLATVLIQNGTLNVGDNIVAGMAFGRVRAMVNDRGERVKTAGPSTPVEISGFTDVPSAGDEMMAVADDRLSRQVVEERRDKLKASRVATQKVSLDNLFAGISEGKVENLNIIIKADVQGSVEAVKQALEKLSNDQVKVHVLHSAVGAITQDDVNLASAFNAIIIGFNIRPDTTARDAADKEGVDIRLYRIIYQAIEDVEKAMKGLLAPEYKEVLLGHAQVRNVFKITGAGTIAGCYVQDGKVQRNANVRLLRDNVVVFEGKLSSLRRFKDDVKECAMGYECGMSLENYADIKENDIIECFIMEEIER